MAVIKLLIFAVIFVVAGKNFFSIIGNGRRLYEEEKGAKNSGETVKMTRITDVKVGHEKDRHNEDDDYTRLVEVYKAKYEYSYNGKTYTVNMRSYSMLSPYETEPVNPDTGRVLTLIDEERANKVLIAVICGFACPISGIACISIICTLLGLI